MRHGDEGSADCDDLGPCTVEVDQATGLATWALGDLDSGEERTVTFAVTVDASPDGTAISEPTPPAPVPPRVLPFTGASSLELFADGTGVALLGALLVGLGRARRASG